MSVSAVNEQLLNGFDFVLKTILSSSLHYLGSILFTIVCRPPKEVAFLQNWHANRVNSKQ